MISNKSFVTTLAVLGTVVGGVSASPAMARSAMTMSSRVSASDRHFMQAAAQGGIAEVALGQLAARKGSMSVVRRFGRRMVHDHSMANASLKALARRKGVMLPTGMKAEDRRLHTRLSRLSGRTFDRSYMRAMINDHVKDVAEFQKESGRANDTDLHNFVIKTLPTLQDHLVMARRTMGIIEANRRPMRRMR